MTKRYTHLSEAHTRGVVERMNRAVFGGVVIEPRWSRAIDLQKMFRARLRRNRTQRFAVTRHQGGNGLWRLGKVQQRVVHSCL